MSKSDQENIKKIYLASKETHGPIKDNPLESLIVSKSEMKRLAIMKGSKLEEIKKSWEMALRIPHPVTDEIKWLFDRVEKLEKVREAAQAALDASDKPLGMLSWLGEEACAVDDLRKSLKKAEE